MIELRAFFRLGTKIFHRIFFYYEKEPIFTTVFHRILDFTRGEISISALFYCPLLKGCLKIGPSRSFTVYCGNTRPLIMRITAAQWFGPVAYICYRSWLIETSIFIHYPEKLIAYPTYPVVRAFSKSNISQLLSFSFLSASFYHPIHCSMYRLSLQSRPCQAAYSLVLICALGATGTMEGWVAPGIGRCAGA